MGYYVTDKDKKLLKQHSRTTYAKIAILNSDFQVIETIEGNVIDGSYSIDSSSDIRRTIDLSIAITDKTFDFEQKQKIWLDKYLRIYIGYEYIPDGTILWYLKGTYIFCDLSYAFDGANHTLSLSCSDLTAVLDGTRNGYIKGLITKVEEGEKTKNVVVAIVTQDGKIKNYRVTTKTAEELGDWYGSIVAEYDEIPYDLKFEIGLS